MHDETEAMGHPPPANGPATHIQCVALTATRYRCHPSLFRGLSWKSVNNPRRDEMKTRSLKWLYRVLAIASPMYLAAGFAQAQSAAPSGMAQVTRAGILRELQELESVGYNPTAPGDTRFPDNLQQALQKLDAKHRAEAGAAAESARPGQAAVTQ
ncbi:hypothetical protein CJO82_09155 [Ralstonia solanacearum]|nr:hypothetical protein CJO82_09155 [Ralstonia solanacearum]AXW23746.1 hypothetical protein CJO86_09160 [Ralstonia solanacearum]AXW80678.1 hypothetical protein CJO98_09390 [Ralstonia solanacearum]